MSSVPAAVRAELAPSGRLRAGVNHGNFLIVSGTRDGVPVGVAPDLGRELRSEERRVGKECRARGSPGWYKKKRWTMMGLGWRVCSRARSSIHYDGSIVGSSVF